LLVPLSLHSLSGHDVDLLPRRASDGLDLRHEFELVERILHLIVLQEISHRYIKDATESPEISCGALLDLSSEPVEIVVVVSRRLIPKQSQ
jgi:hypothetical protein